MSTRLREDESVRERDISDQPRRPAPVLHTWGVCTDRTLDGQRVKKGR